MSQRDVHPDDSVVLMAMEGFHNQRLLVAATKESEMVEMAVAA
jgi:hypothetical protein